MGTVRSTDKVRNGCIAFYIDNGQKLIVKTKLERCTPLWFPLELLGIKYVEYYDCDN